MFVAGAEESAWRTTVADQERLRVQTRRPLVDSALTEQQLGLKQAEERLYRDYIHRLAKASPDYPNYQYLCRLCSVHIENVQGAHKHIKEKRHKKNITEKQEENELRALPPPSAAQISALDRTVTQTALRFGLSDDDFAARQSAVRRMERTVQERLPGNDTLTRG
uniref:Terminal uridylyltransferase 4/7 nucleotidyltransferase domain-containing protein n=1 Tax=Neogobius melanostomus TaxID=47308 RepID=A0A8C6WS40_9GOBI